jgi:hypothetical protein
MQLRHNGYCQHPHGADDSTRPQPALANLGAEEGTPFFESTIACQPAFEASFTTKT